MTFLHSYCLGTEHLQFRHEFLCLISVSCKDSLEHDIKINEKEQTASVREFVYISKEEVNRSEGPYVKTLIGTRTL